MTVKTTLRLILIKNAFCDITSPPLRIWSSRNQAAVSHRDVIYSTQARQTQLISRLIYKEARCRFLILE